LLEKVWQFPATDFFLADRARGQQRLTPILERLGKAHDEAARLGVQDVAILL
jgi:hypothetical protein